jgi:hypothetical protein
VCRGFPESSATQPKSFGTRRHERRGIRKGAAPFGISGRAAKGAFKIVAARCKPSEETIPQKALTLPKSGHDQGS